MPELEPLKPDSASLQTHTSRYKDTQTGCAGRHTHTHSDSSPTASGQVMRKEAGESRSGTEGWRGEMIRCWGTFFFFKGGSDIMQLFSLDMFFFFLSFSNGCDASTLLPDKQSSCGRVFSGLRGFLFFLFLYRLMKPDNNGQRRRPGH